MNYIEHGNSAFCKGPLVHSSFLRFPHNSVAKSQTQDKWGHNLIAIGKKHGSGRSHMKKGKREEQIFSASESPSVFFSVML